jgi:DNA topoisomerase-2
MKLRYTKKTQREHVLLRPDTYIGAVDPHEEEEYVSELDSLSISKKKITYAAGLLRIFIEPLSNAIDNMARTEEMSKSNPDINPMTKIEITIDEKTAETKIWNDGYSIPVEMHPEENCYNHTLIFGNLLTGSNYDDTEDRKNISGRNGLGIKLTNIFSKSFSVKGGDFKNRLRFSQTWRNNMETVEEPVIKKMKSIPDYTEISYIPDLQRFGIEPDESGSYTYPEAVLCLYKKYIIEAAMLTKLDVYYNGKLIPIRNLSSYAKLYSDTTDTLSIKTGDCEVVIQPSDEYEVISYASRVYTADGGTHVDPWCESLFRPIVDKFNKVKKTSSTASASKPKPVQTTQITIKDVKRFFRLFISATLTNPKFKDQSKTKLVYPVIVPKVSKSDIDRILAWPVIENIEEIFRNRELGSLKKMEGKGKYVAVPGLDPANNAGGKLGRECTLILVEGLSAKAYAVHGIETGLFGKKGKDWFGIYPMRGKVLNCRNAKPAKIIADKEVKGITNSLRVHLGVDYTVQENFNKLFYGKVLVLADADVDGIHISGLVQNMFHSLHPTLLERKGFLTAMQTPIVRVFAKPDLIFYDEREFRKYVSQYTGKKKIDFRYYKGLATSTNKDIEESFGKKIIEFASDKKILASMNKVFNNKYSDQRKEWIGNFDPTVSSLKWDRDVEEQITVNISDYLETELVRYSLTNCQRSIPNVIDGLKESQRKVLYGCFLKGLKYTGKSIKVAQLGGYISEHTSYHHGEQNLYETISKMAQEFVGSNNIPLLFNDGQFGTRLSGGNDMGQPRYIFTRLDGLTQYLFSPEDDALLTYKDEDGDMIEPEFYIPILPMILINGGSGIGTGWSCDVPMYNPLDVITAVKIWIENEGDVVVVDESGNETNLLPELSPWYRGYIGDINKEKEHKYISHGIISDVPGKPGTKNISELPIGYWTDDCLNVVSKMKEDKEISDFKNNSTTTSVNITLMESEDGLICNSKSLKLYTYIHTSNMVLYTETGSLKKFTSVREIIDTFCRVRYSYYTKRKIHRLSEMNRDIALLGNKKRFLTDVLDGEIQLFDEGKGGKRIARSESELYDELISKGYDKIDKRTIIEGDLKIEKEDDDKSETKSNDKLSGFEYLLTLQFRSITAERITKLGNDLASQIKKRDELMALTEKDLWVRDLDVFETQYMIWLKDLETRAKKTVKAKKQPKKRVLKK